MLSDSTKLRPVKLLTQRMHGTEMSSQMEGPRAVLSRRVVWSRRPQTGPDVEEDPWPGPELPTWVKEKNGLAVSGARG